MRGIFDASEWTKGLKRTALSLGAMRNVMDGYFGIERLRTSKSIAEPGALEDFSVAWARKFISDLGLQVETEGTPVTGRPVLFVGNHISFLDGIVHLTQVHSVPVAKADVRSYPFLGKTAAAAGTIFVDRSSKDSRNSVVEAVHDALTKQRRSVTLFPEGTTSIAGVPWRHGIFRLAERMPLEVQPFRLSYSPVRESAFIENDGLVSSLWNQLGLKERSVSIKFFDPLRISPDLREVAGIEAMVAGSQRESLKRLSWEPESKSAPDARNFPERRHLTILDHARS